MYNKTAILIYPVLKRKRKRGLSDCQRKRLRRLKTVQNYQQWKIKNQNDSSDQKKHELNNLKIKIGKNREYETGETLKFVPKKSKS